MLLLLFGLIPMLVVVVVVLNSLSSGPPDQTTGNAQRDLNVVTRYCIYPPGRSTRTTAACPRPTAVWSGGSSRTPPATPAAS